MLNLFGNLFTLERTLPEGVLTGILTGNYSIHGGVIRDASGRIVRHLVETSTRMPLSPFGLLNVIPSSVNIYQLHQLKGLTQQILTISSTTMALSGLNLAVSGLGFAAVRSSLLDVHKKLDELDKKVSWIKEFLNTERQSKLLHSLQELADLPRHSMHRHEILHTQRDKFGSVAEHYASHWEESKHLEQAMSYQHFFCMAFMAHARCSAELGMQDKAVREFDQGMQRWQSIARRNMQEHLIRDDIGRFFQQPIASHVSSSSIVGWLDFANDSKKGFDWIDTIARQGAFESRGALTSARKTAANLFSKNSTVLEGMKREAGYLNNLTSRNSILDGYRTQLQFMQMKGITPSEMDSELSRVTKSLPSDAPAVAILAAAA